MFNLVISVFGRELLYVQEDGFPSHFHPEGRTIINDALVHCSQALHSMLERDVNTLGFTSIQLPGSNEKHVPEF
jgi:hypothetical protein